MGVGERCSLSFLDRNVNLEFHHTYRASASQNFHGSRFNPPTPTTPAIDASKQGLTSRHTSQRTHKSLFAVHYSAGAVRLSCGAARAAISATYMPCDRRLAPSNCQALPPAVGTPRLFSAMARLRSPVTPAAGIPRTLRLVCCEGVCGPLPVAVARAAALSSH
jgi:hypothetical protein